MTETAAEVDFKSWPLELSSDLKGAAVGWCELWQAQNLIPRIRIEVSKRQSTSLGLAYRGRDLVRINHSLLGGDREHLLREVLCHELAHIIAHSLSIADREARPHGREWRALMVAAGFKPRVTVPAMEAGLPRRAQTYGRSRRVRRDRWAWRLVIGVIRRVVRAATAPKCSLALRHMNH